MKESDSTESSTISESSTLQDDNQIALHNPANAGSSKRRTRREVLEAQNINIDEVRRTMDTLYKWR